MKASLSQGLYRSWKTWEVMEFIIISISRPERSWNLSAGHGKSWESNMLSENKKQKDENEKEKITDESEAGFYFITNRHKHAFHPL